MCFIFLCCCLQHESSPRGRRSSKGPLGSDRTKCILFLQREATFSKRNNRFWMIINGFIIRRVSFSTLGSTEVVTQTYMECMHSSWSAVSGGGLIFHPKPLCITFPPLTLNTPRAAGRITGWTSWHHMHPDLLLYSPGFLSSSSSSSLNL